MSDNETSQTTMEVTQAIFKSSAPPILVGGDGNILPCVELCNINYNFQTQDKFTVSNQNGRLFVQTDEGLSSKSTMFPCYTSIDICSAANTPSDKLYTLEDIIITCPSLHRLYVDEKATIFDGEIYIVFKNTYEGSTTYKVLSILLTQTSTMSLATANNCLNAYKLFESLANDLPDKDSERTVSTIADWDINDLLPANKWFYNYTHPNNTNVNWYVFKNPLYIPNLFKTNFISSVSQVTSNGSIETGTTAYNTLYSTISNLQNPVTTDNSFVIFEQRDLTALSKGSGTPIPQTKANTALARGSGTPIPQTKANTALAKRSGTSIPQTQANTLTDQTLYDNGDGDGDDGDDDDGDDDDDDDDGTSSADNYETGDTTDREEIEEQVYEENKAWAITILVINCIYTLLLLIILGFTMLDNKGFANRFVNRFHLYESDNYNWIFYIIIMIIPFVIFTSLYLSFGFGDSDVALTNKIMIPINYFLIISLMIFTGVSHKHYFTQQSSNNTQPVQTSETLPNPLPSSSLTPENIARGLLKKGGKRKIRNRK